MKQKPPKSKTSLGENLVNRTSTGLGAYISGSAQTDKNFDLGNTWWLERKTRKGTQTNKERQEISADEANKLSKWALFEVDYNRTAYEKESVRVTLDRNVMQGNKRLPGIVLEVKGETPDWLTKLLPDEDKEFSKSGWVQGEYKLDAGNA